MNKLTELEEIEIKKNKFWFRASLLLTALIIFIGICVGIGSAATCNGTGNVINSTTISNGCTLNTAGTYNFATGTYNLNGTSSGGIDIQASNILLECNNSLIFGNWSANGNNAFIGIRIKDRLNVTLNNLIAPDAVPFNKNVSPLIT